MHKRLKKLLSELSPVIAVDALITVQFQSLSFPTPFSAFSSRVEHVLSFGSSVAGSPVTPASISRLILNIAGAGGVVVEDVAGTVTYK